MDFGNGPRLFIDNYADAEGILEEFKDYLEDETFKKVWHNYGFDGHVFFNHGIDVRGFGGDTQHMARLLDPSRLPGDYALSELSAIYEEEIETTKRKMLEFMGLPSSVTESKIAKVSMKKSFAYYKRLKTGGVGKILHMPSVEELHTSSEFVRDWIEYATFDAEITYFLRETLALQLRSLRTDAEGLSNNLNLYLKYWRPFGELLTDMEREGFQIDLEHMKQIE